MKAEEIRNLNWVKVENWDSITQSDFGKNNKRFIGTVDVDSFVDNIFRDIARKLNIPANELLPVLKDENEPFYKVKEKIYSTCSGLGKDSEYFKDLKGLLRIPNIPFVGKENVTVSLIIDECLKLSDEDKVKVMNEFNSKLRNDLRIDDQKVIEYFNNLSDLEKYNVMKYLELFEVKVEIKPR